MSYKRIVGLFVGVDCMDPVHAQYNSPELFCRWGLAGSLDVGLDVIMNEVCAVIGVCHVHDADMHCG